MLSSSVVEDTACLHPGWLLAPQQYACAEEPQPSRTATASLDANQLSPIAWSIPMLQFVSSSHTLGYCS